MAFDRRKMQFFKGRVWQAAELEAYHAEQRRTRPVGKKTIRSVAFMAMVAGLTAASMHPVEEFRPPKLY